VNKDASAWTRQWFEDNLTKLEAKEGDVAAKITKVISMTGDVEVAQRKGKVITIFDVKLTLEYAGTYFHRIKSPCSSRGTSPLSLVDSSRTVG
jgi:activator of HSP90 ATPase